MEKNIELLLQHLGSSGDAPDVHKCLVGFDGYIDRIIRVVKSSRSSNDHEYFSTIREFAGHLLSASGKSADMRTITQETRIGGNGPILASALARLGMESVCIGALGYPAIDAVFRDLPANCTPISIGESGHTDAFEFNDGKLMFGNVSGFDGITWGELKRQIGMKRILEMVRSSDLIGVVNWSALHGTETILEGLLEEVFPYLPAEELSRKYLTIDLADPSARSKEDLSSLIAILGRLSLHVRLVLCFNEKEARILSLSIDGNDADENLAGVCRTIYRRLLPHTVQIHALKGTVGMDSNGLASVEGTYVAKPKVTTGGGDNFNAGFAFALVCGFPLHEALVAGNAAAASYVTTGESPDPAALAAFIKTRAEQGDYKNEYVS